MQEAPATSNHGLAAVAAIKSACPATNIGTATM